MSRSRSVPFLAGLFVAALSGCDSSAPPAAQSRPVRTVTVEQRAAGEIVSLTGQVRAKDQANLAFRLDGRMIARPVNVGDVVGSGQVVGRLARADRRAATAAA
jgi:membrane fusion protein, multidrug efflux system